MYVNLKLNKRKAGAVSSQKKNIIKQNKTKNSNIPKLDELGPLSPYKSNF